jgi:hypothetical protein
VDDNESPPDGQPFLIVFHDNAGCPDVAICDIKLAIFIVFSETLHPTIIGCLGAFPQDHEKFSGKTHPDLQFAGADSYHCG